MRYVLGVITALMVAAIVFAPSMGYTISPQGKVNYSINSAKENYTIGSGTPAHEIVYNESAKHYPTYSITSTPEPYSFKAGAMAKYSVKLLSNPTKVATVGGYKSSALGPTETIGKGLVVPSEQKKNEQVSSVVAPTPVVSNNTSGNVTTNVTVPAANVTVPAANVTTENVTAPSVAGNNTTTTQ